MKKSKEIIHILRVLFGRPSLVNIYGSWKTGKTDFSLLIAETLQKLKLIKKIGSNIETPDQRVDFVTSIHELKWWLHKDHYRKLYILDEANVHLLRRRAMSRENVEYIKIFGEVSKAHARLIVVSQDIEGIDKELLKPVWCRGMIYKPNLKTAIFRSRYLYGEKKFTNLPKTSISFDPHKVAPFTLEPQESLRRFFKNEETELLWKWANGETSKSLDVHPMKLSRLTRKFVKQTLSPMVEKAITLKTKL